MAGQNETGEAIATMMRAETGEALCDSGGTPRYDSVTGAYLGSDHGYGRGYERAKGRDFEKESEGELKLKFDSDKNPRAWQAGTAQIEASLSVYHWLKDRVTFDPEADKLFGTFAKLYFPRDAWLVAMEAFPAFYAKWKSRKDSELHGGESSDDLYEATGLYDDGAPMTINSYNGESALDGVIQFVYWEQRADGIRARNDSPLLLLQTHNGADVRGGYPRPRFFRGDGDRISDPADLLDFARCTISCPEGHNWQSENGGYTFPYDDGGSGTPLGDYPARRVTPEGGGWVEGCIGVAEDGMGFCPKCGGGLSIGSI